MTSDWLMYFLVTQAVEMPIYIFGLTRTLEDASWVRRVGIAFGASAITHPVVWFVLPPLLMRPLGYWGFVLVAELFAWLTETVYLRGVARLELRVAALWALAANAASLSVGFLLHP